MFNFVVCVCVCIIGSKNQGATGTPSAGGTPSAYLINTPGLTISCSVKSWYWISWINGSITVGSGNRPGYNSYLVFYDIFPIQINYMGMSTFSGTGTSNWTIPGEFYTSSKLLKIESKLVHRN